MHFRDMNIHSNDNLHVYHDETASNSLNATYDAEILQWTQSVDFCDDDDAHIGIPETFRPTQPLAGHEPTSPSSLIPFFLGNAEYRHQLKDILLQKRKDVHYGIRIKYPDILGVAPQLAEQLHDNPNYVIDTLTRALLRASYRMFENIQKLPLQLFENNPPGSDAYTLKPNLQARIVDVSVVPILRPRNISDLRSSDNGKFLSLHGSIIQTSRQKLVERQKWFVCTAPTCGYRFSVHIDVEHDNTILLPPICPNNRVAVASGGGQSNRGGRGRGGFGGSQSRGGDGGGRIRYRTCNSTSFRAEDGVSGSVREEYQEAILQEPVVSQRFHAVPRYIKVVLPNDLVESVEPGDECVISGVLVHKWESFRRGQKSLLEPILIANSITIQSKKMTQRTPPPMLIEDIRDFWLYYKSQGRALDARSVLVHSVCPVLKGMNFVKLALLCILIGGLDSQATTQSRAKDGFAGDKNGSQNATQSRSTAPSGGEQPEQSAFRVRSNCHMLLVGDPGTGKSQLLHYAMKLIPRSVYTTGIGSSNAGLTSAAVQKDGDWQLEAGALVLADKGLLVIDEFSTLRHDDQSALHEALEQQTISVAKTGMVVQLQTRCTLLGACNPRGKVSMGDGVANSANAASDLEFLTGVGTPLLSRFDLILCIVDAAAEDHDKKTALHILQRRVMPSLSILEQESIIFKKMLRKYRKQMRLLTGVDHHSQVSAASSLSDVIVLGNTEKIRASHIACTSFQQNIQQSGVFRSRPLLTDFTQYLPSIATRTNGHLQNKMTDRHVFSAMQDKANDLQASAVSPIDKYSHALQTYAEVFSEIPHTQIVEIDIAPYSPSESTRPNSDSAQIFLGSIYARTDQGFHRNHNNFRLEDTSMEQSIRVPIKKINPTTLPTTLPTAAQPSGEMELQQNHPGERKRMRDAYLDRALQSLRMGVLPEQEYNPTQSDKSSAPPSLSLSTRYLWSLQRMSLYLAHIRTTLAPPVPPPAQMILKHYYLHARQNKSLSAFQTSTRVLESLIRLTHAHAKLMYRSSALVQDAIMAIYLVRSSYSPIFANSSKRPSHHTPSAATNNTPMPSQSNVQQGPRVSLYPPVHRGGVTANWERYQRPNIQAINHTVVSQTSVPQELPVHRTIRDRNGNLESVRGSTEVQEYLDIERQILNLLFPPSRKLQGQPAREPSLLMTQSIRRSDAFHAKLFSYLHMTYQTDATGLPICTEGWMLWSQAEQVREQEEALMELYKDDMKFQVRQNKSHARQADLAQDIPSPVGLHSSAQSIIDTGKRLPDVELMRDNCVDPPTSSSVRDSTLIQQNPLVPLLDQELTELESLVVDLSPDLESHVSAPTPVPSSQFAPPTEIGETTTSSAALTGTSMAKSSQNDDAKLPNRTTNASLWTSFSLNQESEADVASNLHRNDTSNPISSAKLPSQEPLFSDEFIAPQGLEFSAIPRENISDELGSLSHDDIAVSLPEESQLGISSPSPPMDVLLQAASLSPSMSKQEVSPSLDFDGILFDSQVLNTEKLVDDVLTERICILRANPCTSSENPNHPLEPPTDNKDNDSTPIANSIVPTPAPETETFQEESSMFFDLYSQAVVGANHSEPIVEPVPNIALPPRHEGEDRSLSPMTPPRHACTPDKSQSPSHHGNSYLLNNIGDVDLPEPQSRPLPILSSQLPLPASMTKSRNVEMVQSTTTEPFPPNESDSDDSNLFPLDEDF